MAGSVIVAGQAGNIDKGMVAGLQNYGYTVFAIENGSDALELVKSKGGMMAIVVNASLKGLSCIDLCRQIKDVSRNKKVPVLILEDVKIDRKMFKDIGVNHFFSVPYSTASVARTIKSLGDEDGAFPDGAPNLGKQLILAVIMLVVGFGVLAYFIFIPLFLGKTPIRVP